MIQPIMSEKLIYWIRERENIRKLKDSNKLRPWTPDPILQTYKFCNVRREDDTVTKWFAKNWRSEKYWDEVNFVPAIILGRTINWPDTLTAIGFPHTWDPHAVRAKMDDLQMMGRKVYTGAYMITAGPTGVSKNLWVTGNANSYFARPLTIAPRSIRVTWNNLMAAKYPCVGPFIAGQVIADLKQTKHLRDAHDWWTWAAVGPGSARGLNRLHGRPVTKPVSQNQGLMEMLEVRGVLKLDWLCLQDVQNCLCEFDKYIRVYSGEGKPRSGYAGR